MRAAVRDKTAASQIVPSKTETEDTHNSTGRACSRHDVYYSSNSSYWMIVVKQKNSSKPDGLTLLLLLFDSDSFVPSCANMPEFKKEKKKSSSFESRSSLARTFPFAKYKYGYFKSLLIKMEQNHASVTTAVYKTAGEDASRPLDCSCFV